MAKTNFSFEKRQRELKKQQKKEEKQRRKAELRNAASTKTTDATPAVGETKLPE